LEYLEHPLIRSETVEFRLYQKLISDVASERNTLVILPTALGKTVIAVIVAANVLYNYRDLKVLVLAPTRPLVAQHRDSFIRMLKLREKDTYVLTGETSPSERKGLWESHVRLFFSTPQVVRNDLRSRRLSLRDFGLVVFDECHRAVKRYAYTDIARIYVSQTGYPLILGMTASPGSELSRVMEVCENLFIEHVEHRNEEDPDVKLYIQSIDMEWVTVELPEVYLAVRAQIRSMLDRRLRWLHSLGVVKSNPPFVYRRELIEVGNELRYNLEESIEEERGRFFAAILSQSLALTLYHMLELLETQGMHSLRSFLMKVEQERKSKRSYAILAKDPRFIGLRDLVDRTQVDHPKVGILKSIVVEQVSGNPSSASLQGSRGEG
jgi:ERCC4-related helicase